MLKLGKLSVNEPPILTISNCRKVKILERLIRRKKYKSLIQVIFAFQRIYLLVEITFHNPYCISKQWFPLWYQIHFNETQFSFLSLKFQRFHPWGKIHDEIDSIISRTYVYVNILIKWGALSDACTRGRGSGRRGEREGIDDARSIHAVGIPLIEDRSSIGRGRIACGGRWQRRRG